MARVEKRDLPKEIMRQLQEFSNRLTAIEKNLNPAPISRARAKPTAKVLPFRLREQKLV